MGNMTLVIVQDVPTQFDVPLYARITQEAELDLHVFYTAVQGTDQELGHKPIWDHLANCRYQATSLNDISKHRSVNELAESIIELQPKHVIISGYWPKLHRDLMRRLRRVGISTGLRSDTTLAHSRVSGPRGWLKKRYLNRLLRNYTYWHPTGSLALGYLQTQCQAKIKVAEFPYNVDTGWFARHAELARSRKRRERARFGFAADAFLVLGIMKWHDREDPLTLIRGFREFSARVPTARLLLIGDGPLRRCITEQVLKMEERVVLGGVVPYSALPTLYAIADVFVHPARAEPWGVSVSEALACGTPVIASKDVGAAIDIVQEQHTGSLFETGNGQDLFTKLLHWHHKLTTMEEACEHKREIQTRCKASIQAWNYSATIATFKGVLSGAN